MESYDTTDFKPVKQELSDVLCEDKADTYSKAADLASGCIFQELANKSNIEPTMTESDYKVLFNLENCSHISENVPPMIEINKNPPLTNENFQFHNMKTEVNQTQLCRGFLDFTDSTSSICSKIQAPLMLGGCDLSVIAEKKTQKVEKPYEQQVCDAAVTETDHLNEENCHNCDDGITSFLQDVQGNKRSHTELRPSKYVLTGSSFARAEHLKDHKRIHTGDEPYTSDVWGISFSQVGNLTSHKRAHREKPYICEVCGVSFANFGDLILHKRTHMGKKPYKCDVCGVSVANFGDLIPHKRSHMVKKPYKCDVCEASFVNSSYLKRHKRKHTGEKPYKCDVCNASFALVGGVKRHIRTHTGEKPYKCDVCNASFALVGGVKCHIRTHIGEKPYNCDVCEASFNHTGNLKRHKRKHRGKPYKCNVWGVSFA